ncbi:MAG: hypothetical protein Q9M97_06790, partial [Candidatus Gracilibacteria bacterium]|nr:hypothetical protein [Candidatus Gracilibacteria bacterium]
YMTKNLDNFNIDGYLEIKTLFKNKQFINLDIDTLKKIDNGLKVKGNFNYNIGEDLFVYSNNIVTHIVKYDGNMLKSKRKI